MAQQQTKPVIPLKASRHEQHPYNKNINANRNKVERIFGRLNEARGFIIRYENLLRPLWLSPRCRLPSIGSEIVHIL